MTYKYFIIYIPFLMKQMVFWIYDSSTKVWEIIQITENTVTKRVVSLNGVNLKSLKKSCHCIMQGQC